MVLSDVFQIGFTGTKNGMTEAQQIVFQEIIQLERQFIGFHHGDCVGADAHAHLLVQTWAHLRPEKVNIYIYPGPWPSLRAYCPGDLIYPPKPPLERNRDIVNAADLMIATPKESHEVLRSGTWATIRYTLKARKPLIIIYPDGSIQPFGPSNI